MDDAATGGQQSRQSCLRIDSEKTNIELEVFASGHPHDFVWDIDRHHNAPSLVGECPVLVSGILFRLAESRTPALDAHREILGDDTLTARLDIIDVRAIDVDRLPTMPCRSMQQPHREVTPCPIRPDLVDWMRPRSPCLFAIQNAVRYCNNTVILPPIQVDTFYWVGHSSTITRPVSPNSADSR